MSEQKESGTSKEPSQPSTSVETREDLRSALSKGLLDLVRVSGTGVVRKAAEGK